MRYRGVFLARFFYSIVPRGLARIDCIILHELKKFKIILVPYEIGQLFNSQNPPSPKWEVSEEKRYGYVILIRDRTGRDLDEVFSETSASPSGFWGGRGFFGGEVFIEVSPSPPTTVFLTETS